MADHPAQGMNNQACLRLSFLSHSTTLEGASLHAQGNPSRVTFVWPALAQVACCYILMQQGQKAPDLTGICHSCRCKLAAGSGSAAQQQHLASMSRLLGSNCYDLPLWLHSWTTLLPAR